jgi:hypothetical protein
LKYSLFGIPLKKKFLKKEKRTEQNKHPKYLKNYLTSKRRRNRWDSKCLLLKEIPGLERKHQAFLTRENNRATETKMQDSL